jgi:hypothetical protein
MEGFTNEFAANPQILPALIVFVSIALPIFGYFYNRLMDRLNGTKEHTSLYVAIGVAVTLLAGGLFSWRAALMYAALFTLSGLPMIAGEFRRTEEKKAASKTRTLRRKRLPYAANGRIEDAYDSVKEAQRLIGLAFKNNGTEPKSAVPMAEASHQLSTALIKLMEVKAIQQVDE